LNAFSLRMVAQSIESVGYQNACMFRDNCSEDILILNTRHREDIYDNKIYIYHLRNNTNRKKNIIEDLQYILWEKKMEKSFMI